jgi:hypothetical protein
MEKIGRKGLAIETIVYIVVAIVGLIILWIVLSKLAPAITSTTENIVRGLGCEICNMLGTLGWIFSGFCRSC